MHGHGGERKDRVAPTLRKTEEKMRNDIAVIRKNERIAEGFYEMTLQPGNAQEALEQIRPGQFINVKLEGQYLRRPISICDWDAPAGTITIIYKVIGEGTRQMSRMEPEEKLNILWPLGNGYALPETHACGAPLLIGDTAGAPLLIGGGAGAPPLVGLCRKLMEKAAAGRAGKAGAEADHPVVILGFRTKSEIICRERFEELGAEVIVATEDGSEGIRGFVTDAICERFCLSRPLEISAFYTCGPEPMLRAVDEMLPEGIPGQVSFEERMGCGFGACMGCSHKTKHGSKRICKEGPVLERSEIVWE